MILPLMTSAFSASTLVVRSAGTRSDQSWYGAIPTPSFSRVPMNGLVSNSPLPAATIASFVPTSMPLRIEVSRRLPTEGSVSNTSASTPTMAIWRPESWMATAADW